MIRSIFSTIFSASRGPEGRLNHRILEDTKVVKVIYHSGCKDGWGAAFTIYRLMLLLDRPHPVKLQLIPENHSFRKTKELLDELRSDPTQAHDTVLIYADIAPNSGKAFKSGRAVLEELYGYEWDAMYVLDHHKSTIDESGDLPYFYHDLQESGASLTWLVAGMPKLTGIDMPHLHSLVRALDIHSKDYPDWEVLGMAMDSYYKKSLRDWETLLDGMEHQSFRDELKALGQPLLRYRDQICGMITRSARPYRVKLDGHRALASNSPIFSSVIAEKMFKHCELYLSYSFNGTHWYFSIRSSDKGPDCTEIAKKYGGGGHARASGFRVESLDELDLQILEMPVGQEIPNPFEEQDQDLEVVIR